MMFFEQFKAGSEDQHATQCKGSEFEQQIGFNGCIHDDLDALSLAVQG